MKPKQPNSEQKKHGYILIYGDSQSAPRPSPYLSSHHGTPPHSSAPCSTDTSLQVKAQLESDGQSAYTYQQSISRLGQDTVLAGMRWATSSGGNTLHARARVCQWGGSKPRPDAHDGNRNGTPLTRANPLGAAL
jgi:hypothetical protein